MNQRITMSTVMNDQQMDQLLRTAMPARDEPLGSSNLADRVIATATRRQATRVDSSPRSASIRQTIVTVLAVVLMSVVIVVGGMRLYAVQSASSIETASETSVGNSDWDSSLATTFQMTLLLQVGAIGLGAAIIAVALQGSANVRDDDPLRLLS